jgi:hypothetical protein
MKLYTCINKYNILIGPEGRFLLILERLRYPGSGLRVRVSPFCLPTFADVSIFSAISTRFPGVNHGLQVKDKRVRMFSVYYLWAV